jgi:hypothetical protein
MRVSAMLAAMAVAGLAGAAQADEWATGADVRCVVAFTALVNNPTYRDAAASGIFYYVGRLEGRDPTLDLAKALRQVRGAMQTSQYGSEAQRCGAELKAKNDELKAMASGGQAPPNRGVGVR